MANFIEGMVGCLLVLGLIGAVFLLWFLIVKIVRGEWKI